MRQNLDADSYEVLCNHRQGRGQPKKRPKREENARVVGIGLRGANACHAGPPPNSEALVLAGYAGLLDVFVHLRNCAAMLVFCEHLPDDSKELVYKELDKRGLARTDMMV